MSKKLLLLFFSFVLVLILTSACSVLVTTETPTSNIISSTATLSPETPQPEETNILEEIVVERTPLPTALPGPIQQEVERAVTQAGLARTHHPWLPSWIISREEYFSTTFTSTS